MIDIVLGEASEAEKKMILEHLENCPVCAQDFELINACIDSCADQEEETCSCHFQSEYWEEFVVNIHKQIRYERPNKPFPFAIVLPIAAGAAMALLFGYFVLIRPSAQQTARRGDAQYYQYDPYDEINDLTPEEKEQFIQLINQYFGQ
jgi:hypothetical protein